MLKYIWAFLITAGLAAGLATGNGEAVSAAVTDGANTAAELCLSMLGAYALYMGLLGVLDDAGAVKSLARRAAAPLRFIFPGLKNQKAKSYIALNMVANFLGMGNAATPLGIRAARRMARGCEGTASDELCLLVVMNTASLQLIPTTVASLRAAAGSWNPFDILPAVWLASAVSVTVGITAAKLFARGWR